MFFDECLYENKKYVYKNNGSEHLLIILNTHNQGDKYFGFKTIIESSTKVDFLFLTDPYNKYYLDDNNGETYINLVLSITEFYDLGNVTVFGTSMAGFAALYLGMMLNLNVISINPQINLNSARELAWPELKNTLLNLESSCDLEKLIIERYSGQYLFLVFGQHRLDKQSYKEFVGLKISSESINIRVVNSFEHKFFLTNLKCLIDIHFLGVSNRRINSFISA